MCHARAIAAPRTVVWDELHRVTMSAAPFGVDTRGLASPACPALGQEAAAVGRTLLSRRNAHSGPVLRATRCRDLGRTQPGLAPIGRVDTAATGRGGFASLVATGMDQGRDGVSPRTHPARYAPEHRDPRSRDGPGDTAGLRDVLVLHPPEQWCDSSRGVENRRAPRRIPGRVISLRLDERQALAGASALISASGCSRCVVVGI